MFHFHAGNVIGFIAGCSLTWTSPELKRLEEEDEVLGKMLDKDSSEIAWIGGLMPFGAIFGPIVFGYLANRIGRKPSLLIAGIPFTAGYLILAVAGNEWAFMVARFLIGVGVGAVFTVLPMYIAEVAEDSNRGALGSSMNCFICLGLLCTYSIGPYVSWVVFNVILTICPIAFMPLFWFLGTETPHHLIGKGDIDGAKQVLQKLRGQDSEKEFNVIHETITNESEGSFKDLFQSKANKKAVIISLGLLCLQQMSGINAVLFFAEDIFDKAGTSLSPAVCSILVGLTQFLTSFVSPLLADRLGRKILLVASAVGMFIAEVPLGVFFHLQNEDPSKVEDIKFLPILCLIFYIITYNSGFGPLPWSVSAELFPNNVKSVASTLSASVCWFFGFLIAFFFGQISSAIGQGPAFWIFSGFCAIAFVFSQFYVIETKGKNINEIQKILEN